MAAFREIKAGSDEELRDLAFGGLVAFIDAIECEDGPGRRGSLMARHGDVLPEGREEVAAAPGGRMPSGSSAR